MFNVEEIIFQDSIQSLGDQSISGCPNFRQTATRGASTDEEQTNLYISLTFDANGQFYYRSYRLGCGKNGRGINHQPQPCAK
jgi:hypothetical protein